jgi:hypothetical protein
VCHVVSRARNEEIKLFWWLTLMVKIGGRMREPAKASTLLLCCIISRLLLFN